jgi:hypothetical protein
VSRVASAALLISAVCPYCGDTPAVSLDGHTEHVVEDVQWSRWDSTMPVEIEPPRYRLTHSVPAAPGGPRWERHAWIADTLFMSRVLALHVEVL